MIAAVVAPIAGWLAGSLASNRCNCIISIDSVPEPSAGVLSLLREQLQRCGPEQLHAQAVSCPAPFECPKPPAAWGEFGSGIVIGFLLAFALAFCFDVVRRAHPRPRAILDGSSSESFGASPAALDRHRRPPNAR